METEDCSITKQPVSGINFKDIQDEDRVDHISHSITKHFSSYKRLEITKDLTLILAHRIKLSFYYGRKYGWNDAMSLSDLKWLLSNIFNNRYVFPKPFKFPEDDIHVRFLMVNERTATADNFVPLAEGCFFFWFPCIIPKDRIMNIRKSLLEKLHGIQHIFCGTKYELRTFVSLSEDADKMMSMSKLSSINHAGLSQKPPALIIKGLPLQWFVEQPDSSEPSKQLLRIFLESFGNVSTFDVTQDEISVQYNSCDDCREALKSLSSCSLQKEGTNERIEYTVMLEEESTECGDNMRQLEYNDPSLLPFSEKQHFAVSSAAEERDVLRQNVAASLDSTNTNGSYDIQPIAGLDEILKELLKEKGITEVRIRREGFQRRVVSQDLQLWLSNAPVMENQYILYASVGMLVQEIQVTTTLDREGIKKALQLVFERVS